MASAVHLDWSHVPSTRTACGRKVGWPNSNTLEPHEVTCQRCRRTSRYTRAMTAIYQQCNLLRASWDKTVQAVNGSPAPTDQQADAEQAAHDKLVEYVDEHGLTYTSWDPRGEDRQ